MTKNLGSAALYGLAVASACMLLDKMMFDEWFRVTSMYFSAGAFVGWLTRSS